MPIGLSSDTRLLFIGDSITDCGRKSDPEGIGNGYVRMVRDWLRAACPAAAPQIVNRGISGNKVTDLAARWEADVIAERPDVLSIKVGVNDVWHGLGGRDAGVGIEQFTPVYRRILSRLREALPACHLILCQPSVIWPPQPPEGNDILKPYVAAIADLAAEFAAQAVVPLHAAFESARRERPDIVWAPDGVHPSSSGHMLIARTWLATLNLV